MPNTFEFVFVIEFLLILSMASFHCSILSWFAGVNQIMDDVVLLAENIQRMNCFDSHIASLSHTSVVISEQ